MSEIALESNHGDFAGMEKRYHYYGIDFCRFVLVCLVYYSHSKYYINLNSNFSAGACAVEVFFVLSGFFAANSYKRKGNVLNDTITYFFKRIKRYWPLHFVTLLFAIPIHRGNFNKFIFTVFLLQSYRGDPKLALTLNWPAWYLSSLMLAIFLTPILIRAINKLVKTRQFVFGIILIGIIDFAWAFYWRNEVITSKSAGYYYVYIFPVARLFDYVSGILLYKFWQAIKLKISSAIQNGLLLLLAMVLIIVLNLPNIDRLADSYKYVAIWYPIAHIMILACAGNKKEENGTDRITIAEKLGQYNLIRLISSMSFEIYLIHRLVLKYFELYLEPNAILYISTMMMTLVLSYLAKAGWGYIERVSSLIQSKRKKSS